MTEGVYVGKLRHIVRDYMPMLDGEAKAYISTEQVFCNVRQLYKFHSQELLPALREAKDDVKAIGKIFRQFVRYIHCYINSLIRFEQLFGKRTSALYVPQPGTAAGAFKEAQNNVGAKRKIFRQLFVRDILIIRTYS